MQHVHVTHCLIMLLTSAGRCNHSMTGTGRALDKHELHLTATPTETRCRERSTDAAEVHSDHGESRTPTVVNSTPSDPQTESNGTSATRNRRYSRIKNEETSPTEVARRTQNTDTA
eukprot:3759461-Pleurochrysis_carterae.AAC.1